MEKMYFHNRKIINQNIKRSPQAQNLNKKYVVDIDKILNRVKLETKNEKKKKFIFFSLVSSIIVLITTLISFIR